MMADIAENVPAVESANVPQAFVADPAKAVTAICSVYRTLTSGNFFTGTLERGKLHGRGLYLWDDGLAHYSGNFHDSRITGSGVRTRSLTFTVYCRTLRSMQTRTPWAFLTVAHRPQADHTENRKTPLSKLIRST